MPDRGRLLALAEECAEETVHACRSEAAMVRQCGIFPEYARWLRENADAAERWLVKRAALRVLAEGASDE